MVYIKNKPILTTQEMDEIQQPIDKDGYENERFSKLYGKDKNPAVGTERDSSRRNRDGYISLSDLPDDWHKRIFGKKTAKYKKNKVNK